jgi:hypothetical protein
MSVRVDTASLIAGAVVVGDRGLGVLGSDVPSTGTNGPGYLYNDLTLPADANKEVRGLIITPPSAGTFFAYEDSGFTLADAPNGTYTFTYRLFEDGVDKGTATETIQIGTATVQADFTSTYAVINAIQSDFASAYGVYSGVQQDYPGTFSISSTVQADHVSAFGVSQGVQQDFAYGYDVSEGGTVSTDFVSSYGVYGSVQQDLVSAFSVSGSVEQDFAHGYTVEANVVVADFDCAYTVIGSATRDFSHAYIVDNQLIEIPYVNRFNAPPRVRASDAYAGTSTPDVFFDPKRPDEEEYFEINFGTIMPKGDSITSAAVTVKRAAGGDVVTSMVPTLVAFSGTRAQQKIRGGVKNTFYHVRFAVITAMGLRLTQVGELEVRD